MTQVVSAQLDHGRRVLAAPLRPTEAVRVSTETAQLLGAVEDSMYLWPVMAKANSARGAKAGKPREAITPSVDRASPPDFHRMQIDAFEELTAALLDKEPGVTRADLFHTRYDAQYGIDSFGDTPDGMIVASSKRQARILKGQMAKWSSDFLDHWEARWRAEGVSKFILSTAAPTHSRERIEDIKAQKARFRDVGVDYEVWSPRQLQEKLRTQRGLVSQYLGIEWVPRLCGVEAGSTEPPVKADGSEAERIAALERALAEGVAQRADAAAARIDLGHAQEVAGEVAELRGNALWPLLSAALQSRVIRLLGSIALNAGDVDAAAGFAAEADTIETADEPRLQASIALRRNGVDAALAALGTPTTASGRAFQASLLFATGDDVAARAAVAQLPEGSAEKYRLSAYAALAAGQLDTARAQLIEGRAVAPDSIPLQRVQAMVLYASALSPLTPPEHFVHATPVSLAFVRQDDEARRMLGDALVLLEGFRDAAGPAAQASDDLWRLACLGNLLERRTEAASLAASILASDPIRVPVIAWARARGLDVDMTASRLALRKALFARDIDTNGVRALDWLTDSDAREALASDLDDLLGNGAWAIEVRDELEALRFRLRGQEHDHELAEAGRAFAAMARRDVASLTAAFEDFVDREIPDSAILAIGEALAAEDAWSVVAKGVALLRRFRTAEAWRLAAFAAFNAGDISQTLEILQEALEHFPGGRLPFDLRRLEARALSRSGQAGVAVDRAATLAAETVTKGDRLLEASLRLEMGDLQGASQVLDQLLSAGALQPRQALAWADRLATEARTTAVALWRFATAEALSDELAMSAYALSFNLGVEHEHPELAAAAGRLALKPGSGVELVNLDRVRDEMLRSRDRLAELDRVWTSGEAPIHIVAASSRTSAAELLRLTPAGPDTLQPVFIRSGVLGAPAAIELLREGRLVMDVTALLVADQLDLLELIERQTPIHIGSGTLEALMQMEERIRPPQPRRAEAAREVVSRLGRGVGPSAPATARAVVHEPETDEIKVDAVVAALRKPRVPDPPFAGPLVFKEQTLDLVAEAGLMDEAVSRFDVYVDADSLQHSRDEVTRDDARADLLTWLSRLRTRLSAGIADGRYVLLPVTLDPESGDPGEAGVRSHPLSRNLLELMQVGEGARLWIDDRFASNFTHFGGAKLLGTLEVLAALRVAGTLGDDAYFAKLIQLRAAGALYISITAEEVVRHLVQASIVDGVVVETPGLQVLRRYVGLSLRYQDRLRVRPGEGPLAGRPSEAQFAIDLRNLLKACVADRWNANVPIETARAQSDWVWESLRSEHFPQMPEGSNAVEGLFAALNYAELISSALLIQPAGGDTAAERRAAYLGWIDEVAAHGRLQSDPELAVEVGRYARDFLRADNIEDELFAEEDRAAYRALARQIVGLSPPKIQEVLAEDDFLRDVGLPPAGVISLQDWQFAAAEFWQAAAEALEAGAAKLRTLEGDTLEVRRRPDLADGFGLEFGGTAEVADSMIGVLVNDEGQRETAITQVLAAADVPGEEAAEVRRSILDAESPHQAMRLVSELRDRSIPWFFRQLGGKIQSGSAPLSAFDPPPASDWLRYLRYAGRGRPLSETYDRLVRDLGETEAAKRLEALPVDLPQALRGQLAGETGRPLTVMARVHRLREMRESLAPESPDLACEVTLAAAASVDHGDIFVAALGVAARSFAYQAAWRDLDPTEKHLLVWTYADRVADMILRLGVEQKAAAATLETYAAQPPVHRSLDLERGYDDSPLRAGVFTAHGVLLAGLEYALGSTSDDVKLDEDQLAEVRAGIGKSHEEAGWVLAPARAVGEVGPFETWLARPTPNAFAEGGDRIEQGLAEAVASIETDTLDRKAWQVLLAFGRPTLPPDLAARLGEVLVKLDSENIVAQEDGVGHLREIAEVAGRFGDRVASDAILNAIFSLCRSWLGPVEGEGFEARLHELFESAAGASKTYDGDGPERLSRFLVSLLGMRPETAKPLRPLLDRLVQITPVAEARPFWHALVMARSGP